MDTRLGCMEPAGYQAWTEVPLLGHPQQKGSKVCSVMTWHWRRVL